MKRLLIVTTWFATSITTLGVSIWFYALFSSTNQGPALIRQEAQILGMTDKRTPSLVAYAAIPGAVTELRTAVRTKDARSLVIENYLKRYGSPMAGMGQFIIDQAEELGAKHEIDPTYLSYLVIAIAQNESNLGKKMPTDCYNAFGFGIHEGGTLCFESWEEGINRMMTTLVEDYFVERNLRTPAEIVKRYTPHTPVTDGCPQGAWVCSIQQFLDDLYQGNL